MKRFGLAIIAITLNIQIISQSIEIDTPVKMLALGDSYTIGASVEKEERWPHQFTAALNAQGIQADEPDYIAVTGWTTQDLLRGIRNSLNSEKNYNLVSILIGVNNQYQHKDIETYEPDLKEIIEIALKVVSDDTGKVFMLSIPDYAYTPFGSGNEKITEEINAYNEINYRVATEYNLTYVNITSISRRGLSEPELVAWDGLHPSGEQYALWVEAVLSYLAPDQILGSWNNRLPGIDEDVIRIFPNPASDGIQLVFTRRPEVIRMLDPHGKTVFERIPSGYLLYISLMDYQPGIYWMEGTFPHGRETVPVVIN